MAHITAVAARSLCKTYMPGYDKSPQMSRLLDSLELAEARAATLCLQQTRNEMALQNPWTDVHNLAAAIRNVAI